MRYIRNILIVMTVLVMASCSSNKKSDNTLTFGVMSSMEYLPLAIAQREGFFEEEGIKVKLQKFLSANERDVALQSGAVDGVVTDYTSAVLVQAGGFDLKLTSKCQAPFYIMASNQSGVSNLSELKGKKIAVSQNTVIDFCVDMALASVGLTPADVEKVDVNKIPLRLEMLRNNKIDATGLPDPLGTIAMSDECKTLVMMDSLGYTVTGMVFTQKAIDEKAETIKKFYKAYNKGVAYIEQSIAENSKTKYHPLEDIKDILIKDMGFPEGMAYNATIPQYTKAQAPTASDKDIEDVVIWLKGRSLIPDSFNIEEMIDSCFVAE